MLIVGGLVFFLLVTFFWKVSSSSNKIEHQTNSTTVSPSQSSPLSPLLAAIETDYSSKQEAEAYAADGFPLLYFTSKSCSSCQDTLMDVEENASKVPAGVKIFKVDFASQQSLAYDLGVTEPGTWVQINASGDVIRTWNGGGVSYLIANMLSK